MGRSVRGVLVSKLGEEALEQAVDPEGPWELQQSGYFLLPGSAVLGDPSPPMMGRGEEAVTLSMGLGASILGWTHSSCSGGGCPWRGLWVGTSLWQGGGEEPVLQEHPTPSRVTRPRKLLVFVNPVGGRCRASEIYRDRVAGLFALAGIQTEVIVTPRSLAPRLVCVGGDGTFNELMHALISRTQRKAGIPEDNPTAPLLPPRLRIGIIPAGSTDCICFATVGTNDPVTSALHIIIGDSQPLDVCSVHHHERLLRYAVSLVGYGFYGDVVSDSERHRWMGPMRYDFSGFKAVLCNRSYEGTVEFLTVGGTEANPRDQTRCRAQGCLSPSQRVMEGWGEWQREQGRFLAINLTCMSSACPKSPDGLSPSAHLADGTADLILVRECSALGFLRHLSRHMDHRDQFDLPFVSVHRVRALRFTPKQLEDDDEGEQPGRRGWKGLLGGLCCGEQPLSSWSCDGETLPHADISVRVHRQLIHLFARGIEQGMGLL
uniref:DAGKc domain-containing protein n=1 Tax=Gopherus evgoodei TaxID=1825980 RepID=A0A8C4Y5T0_9SAUR